MVQQVSKSLLVISMLFPMCEITNMTRASQRLYPFFCTRCNRLVYADRKQDGGFVLIFSRLGDFHFKLHPFTLNGVLRENEDEFVMAFNGFDERLSYRGSRLHFKRSKPTDNTTGFQVSFQNLGKDRIFTGIADKAGVILDGHVDEGVSISDESLRHASAAEKTLRNGSTRAHNCICSYGGWAMMFHRSKPLRRFQINISKGCKSYNSVTEVSIIEVGIDEVGMAEISASEICTA